MLEYNYLERVENALAGYRAEIADLESQVHVLRLRLESGNITQRQASSQQSIWISLRVVMGNLKYARRKYRERLEQIKDGSFEI